MISIHTKPKKNKDLVFDDSREYDGASQQSGCLTLQEDGDAVHLHRLRATPEFRGGGTRALRELCACADASGLSLSLKVRPFGSQPLSEAGLHDFYAKSGFEDDPYASDYSSMIRYPDSPESTFRMD